MSWSAVDDRFHSHPKVVRAGNEAIGLWTRCLSWCQDHLTDGRLPRDVVVQFAGDTDSTARLAGRLVTCGEHLGKPGLWEIRDDGWQMHDYLKYQPAAKDVIRKRNKEAERKRKLRGKREESEQTSEHVRADSERTGNGQTQESTENPTGIRLSHAPSPSDLSEKKTNARVDAAPRESADAAWLRLCGVMPGSQLSEVTALCTQLAAVQGTDPPDVFVAAVTAFNALCEGENPGFQPQKSPHVFLRRWEDVQEVMTGRKSPERAKAQAQTRAANGADTAPAPARLEQRPLSTALGREIP